MNATRNKLLINELIRRKIYTKWREALQVIVLEYNL